MLEFMLWGLKIYEPKVQIRTWRVMSSTLPPAKLNSGVLDLLGNAMSVP